MNHHILITGAGKGIGRATALYFAQKDYIVWAGVRTENDAHALRDASPHIRPLMLDVTNPAHIDNAVQLVSAETDSLFALINNAAIMIPSPLEVLDVVLLRRAMAVNVEGPLLMVQAFLPLLRHAKSTIVNISSIAGRIALPVYGPYHTSKFALEGMSDTLRQELAPDGIRVVVIEPGAIDTPIWQTVKGTARQVYAEVDQEKLARYEGMIDRIETTNDNAVSRAVAPEVVARVIERAITSKRPRARYPVGMDGLLIARVVWMLPASWRDWAAAKL